MPLHASRHYIRTVEGVAVTPFECKQCGHKTFAAVRSVGTGEETAGVLSDHRDAKNLAHSRAGHALMANARLIASMARCPACRTVDEATVASARNGALFKSTLVAAIPAGLSYAYHRGEGAPFVLFVVVSIGAVIGACLSFFRDRWRWAEADERVRFLSGAELAAAQEASPVNPPAAELARPDWSVALVWGEALTEAKVTWPFGQRLHLGLMRHTDEGPEWMEPSELDGASRDDARRYALETLRDHSESGLTEVEPGVLHGSWGDGFAASRLALPERFRELGRVVAFVPSEDTLFLVSDGDPARLVRAFHRARDHAWSVIDDNGSHAGRFTARPWVLLEHGWEPWPIPSAHPLVALVNELDAELGPNAWRF